MRFGVIGVSYKEVNMDVRSCVSFRDTEKLDLYDELFDLQIKQAVILTTCNRSEIYFLYQDEQQIAKVIEVYAKMNDTLLPYIVVRKGKEALAYLFEVTCGFHSLVVGEDQILGQMQDAYTLASQAQSCGKEMHKIMQSCFQCAKHCKDTYKISEFPVSIAYLAMKCVKEHQDFQAKRVCIIGSGTMASLLLTYVKEEDVAKIYVCNRTMSTLMKYEEENIEVIPFTKRYEIIKECDIVFSATASPYQIIGRDAYLHTEKAQILMDIASPHDIDPMLATYGNIQVFDIDSLQEIVDEHKRKRMALMQAALPDIHQYVADVNGWLLTCKTSTALQSLQKRSEQIAQDTYDLLVRKLSLDAHEKYVLQKVLHTSFLRTVKEPMMELKKIEVEDQEAYIQMIATLFKTEEEER